MSVFGKIKKLGKTVIKTTYEDSGAQALKKDVQKGAAGVKRQVGAADRAVFGSNGIKQNVQDVRKLLKKK